MTRALIENLPLIAAAPDGIKALRSLILEQAVRGRLVPQDPEDEPASELLERFRKAKLERKRKTGDARIKIEADPVPDGLDMPLPFGWRVQSFENLFLFIDYRGNTPTKTDDGIPLITAKNVRMGYLNREPREYISKETFEAWMTRGFPALGDLLFTTEAPLANICLNDLEVPFALAQRTICLQPYANIDTKFLMFALMSDLMQSLIDKHATGMTARGIKASKLKPLPIPIPPLAEQRRIVAKVDELMVLCDRLEAQQADTEAVHATLVKTLLETLAQSRAADDFAANWQRLSQHFPTIFTTEASVDALKQAVLQLAFIGKLIPTAAWPDSPSPLGRVALLQNGYAFKSEWFAARGVRLLRNANVSHGALSWDEVVHLPEQQSAEFERFRLNEGDIVLSLDRPFINSGTKVARVRSIDLPCLLLQRVGRFQLKKNAISEDYLFLWIQSPHFANQIDPGRSNGVPHISSKQVEAAEIFVPPLTEQRRIVAKVDELLALCDTLKAQIAESCAAQRQLATALVEQTLAA